VYARVYRMIDTPVTTIISIPRLTSRLDYLREVIVSFLSSHKIDDGIISRIELSVYEAVVNIIEHSNKEYQDRDIEIQCSVSEDEVIVIVRNNGDKFDMTEVIMPDIETHYKSGKMRGLGIYFIRTLMDVVEYSHDNEKMINTLRMSKKLRHYPGQLGHI
jgi:anti-sigma regulatory factor (Ser/Thr protein kinase)